MLSEQMPWVDASMAQIRHARRRPGDTDLNIFCMLCFAILIHAHCVVVFHAPLYGSQLEPPLYRIRISSIWNELQIWH